jgi:hypothetical protein
LTDRATIEIPGQIVVDDPLGGDAGRWRRRKLADSLDTTRSWVDPNGYRLADRLWLAKAADRAQIDKHLKAGIIAGDSAVTIAKRLESLLTPEQQLLRNPITGRALPWYKQPKGVATRTPYGSAGSYAARRLARTELTRAFGQGVIQAAKANPFVHFIRWVLSHSHPEADPCDDNASADPTGLGPGIYTIAGVPRHPQHPHCLCHLSPVVDAISTDQIVDNLRTKYGLGANTEATGPVPSKKALLEQKIVEAKKIQAAKKAADDAAKQAAQIAAAEAKAAADAAAKLAAEKAAKEAAEAAAKAAAEKVAKEAAEKLAAEIAAKEATEAAAAAAKAQAARDLKNARLRAARAKRRAEADAVTKVAKVADIAEEAGDPLLAATARDRALAMVKAAEDAGRMPASAAKAMAKDIAAGKLDEEAMRDLYASLGKQIDKTANARRHLDLAEREGVITRTEANQIRAALRTRSYTGLELDEHVNELQRRSRLHRLSRFKDIDAFKKGYSERAFKQSTDTSYERWRQASTKEEGIALNDYKDGTYRDINAHLRGKKRPYIYDDNQIFPAIEHIDRTFERATLDQDGLLMRGTRFSAGEVPDEWRLAKPGDIRSDKGYMSTTMDSTVARDNFGSGGKGAAVWEILAPKGTHGLSLIKRANGSLAHEQEILLKRDTKMLVREVKTERSGRVHITVEILP